jgi:ubiquinone/menaquinone biosynthesis C-methylase UbiE
VGCGDGFYTVPLARFLGPSGKVLAFDTNDGELFKLKQQLGEESLKNVEVIKGVEDDPRLPGNRVDAVLIANAYHEMTAHEAMLRHIRAALKQGGRLVLVEGISDICETKPREEQITDHQLAPQVAKQGLERAGFEIVELRDPLFERPPDEDGGSRWSAVVARKPAH